ncbi:hypothetical protein MMC31_003695 [Peltigera leucophlebia]|nr:hypothetical protein [Peltigera leucophlebia]
MDADGTVFDLNESDLDTCETAPTHNVRSQIQETRPTFGQIPRNEEPWSPLNTRVGNSSSQLHRLLFWQNSPVREQVHAIDNDGGPLVSHLGGLNEHHSRNFPLSSSATAVASIPQYGRAQQNDFVDGRLSESDPGPHSGMPLAQDDQFDEASTATYAPEVSPEQPQGLSGPISRFDGRSEMESTFEPATSQDNLISRSNDMLRIPEQRPAHHESHPVPVVYGYHAGCNLSYRQHLDNYRRCLPYHQPHGTDSQPYQTPHSNLMTGLTRPLNDPLRRSPSHNTMEHTLDGTCERRAVVGPVRRTALAKGAKGVRKGPLPEDARAHARDTRGEGSCWPCKIQRYKCEAECGPDGCHRCQKRRVTSPWRWGCIRTTLPSYASGLLAASLLDQHHPQELTKIFRTHIHEWSSSSIEIHVKWAHGPPIQVKVHEFMPIGTLLVFQDQYILSQHGYERVQVRSLPVGMTEELLEDWRPKMYKYLDRTLDEPDFKKFPENCFRGDENEVQRALIRAICRYYDASSNKRKSILRNSLKLLVCMKLASYSLILDETNKKLVLERMRNPSAADAYGRFTGSRFLNREIKYVVADLHRTLVETELKNLQEALQSSNQKRSWGPTFVSVLILGMVTEIMQHLVRCKASSDLASLDRNDPSSMSRIRAIDTRATAEIEEMERTVEFTRALFDSKYQSQKAGIKNPGFKPIFEPADLDKLDEPSQRLALDVKEKIHEHGGFLGERKMLGPPNGSDDPCVSRLVAEFLLSCTPSLGQ